MILIFGGTTEGKKVAELFDLIGKDYFYSTKTNAHKGIKGKRVFGEMDVSKMKLFCMRNNIRLLIDAAHPFAIDLHKNIYELSVSLKLDVIRYERIFPKVQDFELLRYFDSYDDMATEVLKGHFKNVLALTGVQTIIKLQSLTAHINCYFRILDTPLSLEKAKKTRIVKGFVIPMNPKADADELIGLAKRLNAEILLSKESGESGYFETKVEAASELNIPLWVVKRPLLPDFEHVVDNQKELLQLFYHLKKTALKTEGDLRSGYTSGTCVMAAAKACFIALVEKKFPASVAVELPDGEMTKFAIFPNFISENSISCVVIKDAGDDPDVTHAKEFGCELTFVEKPGLRFVRGEGVGLVTLPGLQVNVGEPAINPVPRKMISDMLNAMADRYGIESGLEVKPFVPEGEKLALQTFNPRIGVVGGISIIGTSGKVMPYSNEAFLGSIRQQMKVAKENGCNEVVLTSGKRSENRLKSLFQHLAPVAFIHFGNMVGETINLAAEEGIEKINIVIMFGKAVKLAEGHLNTHSKNVVFNPEFVVRLAKECGYPENVTAAIEELKLANAIVDFIPFTKEELFYQKVAERCYQNCSLLLSEDDTLSLFLLVGEKGMIKING
jgi:cobalt-precorrin-5B (C1)-methyltransferase